MTTKHAPTRRYIRSRDVLFGRLSEQSPQDAADAYKLQQDALCKCEQQLIVQKLANRKLVECLREAIALINDPEADAQNADKWEANAIETLRDLGEL